MKYKKLDSSEKAIFERDGYLLCPGLFRQEEIDKLTSIAESDALIDKNMYDRGDTEGLKTKLSLWFSLDDSIYSLMARCERIVSGAEFLLGGTVGHFHSKYMKKEPRVGGAWEWHQDYGYWYRDGFMYPDMLSVLTALTPATRENGCLQVLKGSHRLGRLEHKFAGEQVGAEMERVEEATRRLELVHVEMQPGDSLFFHSNLLHRSDSNRSDHPRLSLISVYNVITNKPFKSSNTSSWTPVEKVHDDAIMEADVKGISETVNFNHK